MFLNVYSSHLFTIYSGCLFSPITFAGQPAAVEFSGISFITTTPAAIVVLLPMFTSSTMQTLGPI